MPEIRPTNGVSFDIDHTITTAEDTAGAIIFTFTNTEKYYTAVIQILNDSGVVQTIDVVIDDSVAGQITISDGVVYELTATHVIKGIVSTKKVY